MEVEGFSDSRPGCTGGDMGWCQGGANSLRGVLHKSNSIMMGFGAGSP